jgi:hypothetical protein
MRGASIVGCLLVVCTAMIGCIHADGAYNQPSREKLRVESPTPEAYAVQVADEAAVTVSADGRVVVDIPHLGRGHATYLLGVAKLSISSAYDIAAVHLRKAGRTVRKFSLNDLKRLPTDSEGYRILKVE